MKLQSDSPSDYLPAENLEVGREFSKVWTSIADEFNEVYGGSQYGDIFMLESQIGYFAQKITVTDKAWRDSGKLSVEFPYTVGGQTKLAKSFLPVMEAKMEDEMMLSKERAYLLGKKSTTSFTDSKYPVRTGPGLREQMKGGWTSYFTSQPSAKLFSDYILDITFSRNDSYNRNQTLMTGTLGSILFHTAVASVAGSTLTMDTHFIKDGPSLSRTPGLAYGAQFTKYRGLGGVEIDLTINKMYDSRVLCKQEHPLYPGKPIDSARYTIMDFSKKDGMSNVRLLKEKDFYHRTVVAGTWTPSGPIKGGMGSSLKHGYEIGTASSGGIVVVDASACGELILALN